MNPRTPITGIATLVAVVAFPAAAHATTYCVSKPSCQAAGGTLSSSVDNALAAAFTHAGPDRVEVGPGVFNAQGAAGFSYQGTGDNSLALVGAGRQETTLRGPLSGTTDTQGYSVLELSNAASTVSDLRIQVPDTTSQNVTPTGLVLGGGTAERIDVDDQNVDATPASRSAIDLRANATVRDCSLSGSAATASTGIFVNGANASASDCVTNGSYYGVYVNGGATGTRLTRMDLGAALDGIYVSSGGSADLTSALVRAPVGVVAQVSSNNALATLRVANSTVVGTSTPTSGVDAGVRAYTAGANASARVTLDSSILRDYPKALTYGGPADGSVVTARFSDYDPSTNASLGGASTVDQSEGNINADPLFVDGPGGDYRLAAGSPAIDTANPTPLGAAPASLDLEGRPRPADGDANGSVLPDMGAFEVPGPVPPSPPSSDPPATTPPLVVSPPVARDTVAPAIAASSLSAKRFAVGSKSTALAAAKAAPKGTTVRLRLSEAATVTMRVERLSKGRRAGKRCSAKAKKGKRCSIVSTVGTLTRRLGAGKASVAFSGRIGRRALKPGSYRFVLTARDAAANVSKTRVLGFVVVRR